MGAVEGTGEKICRQLVKYGYLSDVSCVCTCDWESMVLLQLGGNQNEWYNPQHLGPLIEAKGTWPIDI